MVPAVRRCDGATLGRTEPGGTRVASWQLVIIAVVLAPPLLLLFGLHPARERLDARGVPVERSWRPSPPPPPVEDHH